MGALKSVVTWRDGDIKHQIVSFDEHRCVAGQCAARRTGSDLTLNEAVKILSSSPFELPDDAPTVTKITPEPEWKKRYGTLW